MSKYALERFTTIPRGSREFPISVVEGAAATNTFEKAAMMATEREVMNFMIGGVTEEFAQRNCEVYSGFCERSERI